LSRLIEGGEPRVRELPPVLGGAEQRLGKGVDAPTTVKRLLRVQLPTRAVADRGYRGHGAHGTTVLVSGTRRGLTPRLTKLLRRRSTIEPEIGHMKSDGRLARCALKGTIGDALYAVLCGCGHNIRKILAYLRALLLALLASLLHAIAQPDRHPATNQAA
jgi:IS5 family transposase